MSREIASAIRQIDLDTIEVKEMTKKGLESIEDQVFQDHIQKAKKAMIQAKGESEASVLTALTEVTKGKGRAINALAETLGIDLNALKGKGERADENKIFDKEISKNLEAEIKSYEDSVSNSEILTEVSAGEYEEAVKLLEKSGDRLVPASEFGKIKAYIQKLEGNRKTRVEKLFSKQEKILDLCVKADERIRLNNWEPEWSKASCFNAGSGLYNMFSSENVELNTYGWFAADKTLLYKEELRGLSASKVVDILDFNKGYLQSGELSKYKGLADFQHKRLTVGLTPEDVSLEQQLHPLAEEMAADPTNAGSILEKFSKGSGIPFERISRVMMTSAPIMAILGKNPMVLSKLSLLGTFGLYSSVVAGAMKNGGKGAFRAATDFAEYMIPFHGNILDYKDAAYHWKQGNMWEAGMSIFSGTVGMALDVFSAVTIWTGIGPAAGQGGKALLKGGLKGGSKIGKFVGRMWKEDILGSFTRIAWKNPLDIGKWMIGKKSWKEVGLNLGKSSMRARTSTADGKFPGNMEYVAVQKTKVDAEITKLENQIKNGDTSAETKTKLDELKSKREQLEKDGYVADAMNKSDDELQTKKSELETEIKPLREKIAEFERLDKEFNSGKIKLAEFKKRKTDLRKEIVDATKAKTDSEADLKSAETALKNYETELKKYEADMKRVETTILNAETSLGKLRIEESLYKGLAASDPTGKAIASNPKNNKDTYHEILVRIAKKEKTKFNAEARKSRLESSFLAKYGGPDKLGEFKDTVAEKKTIFEGAKETLSLKVKESADTTKNISILDAELKKKEAKLIALKPDQKKNVEDLQVKKDQLDVVNKEISERTKIKVEQESQEKKKGKKDPDSDDSDAPEISDDGSIVIRDANRQYGFKNILMNPLYSRNLSRRTKKTQSLITSLGELREKYKGRNIPVKKPFENTRQSFKNLRNRFSPENTSRKPVSSRSAIREINKEIEILKKYKSKNQYDSERQVIDKAIALLQTEKYLFQKEIVKALGEDKAQKFGEKNPEILNFENYKKQKELVEKIEEGANQPITQFYTLFNKIQSGDDLELDLKMVQLKMNPAYKGKIKKEMDSLIAAQKKSSKTEKLVALYSKHEQTNKKGAYVESGMLVTLRDGIKDTYKKQGFNNDEWKADPTVQHIEALMKDVELETKNIKTEKVEKVKEGDDKVEELKEFIKDEGAERILKYMSDEDLRKIKYTPSPEFKQYLDTIKRAIAAKKSGNKDLDYSVIKGIVTTGVPGTGKSRGIDYIQGELGLSRLQLKSLKGSFHGDDEKNVDILVDILQKAVKDSPEGMIMFDVDELPNVFPHNGGHAEAAINRLQTVIEDGSLDGVIMFGTTNYYTKIRQAMRRRLGKTLAVLPPRQTQEKVDVLQSNLLSNSSRRVNSIIVSDKIKNFLESDKYDRYTTQAEYAETIKTFTGNVLNDLVYKNPGISDAEIQSKFEEFITNPNNWHHEVKDRGWKEMLKESIYYDNLSGFSKADKDALYKHWDIENVTVPDYNPKSGDAIQSGN